METMHDSSIDFFKQQLRTSVSLIRMLEFNGRSIGLTTDHRLGYHDSMHPRTSCPLCKVRSEGTTEVADGPPPALPALAVMPQFELLTTAINLSIDTTKHLLVAYEKSVYVNALAIEHRVSNVHSSHPVRDCPLCTL